MGVENAYSIRSLKHAYDGKVVLDIPYLDIPAGQVCIFSGPNGSGKTTLLSILALMLAPSGGSVSLHAIECWPDPDRELRRMVTLVHQKPVLFSTSVRNNLAYGLKTRGLPAKEIDRRIMSIADAMQISGIINKHTRKLSGGEAQRVILARALVMETPIILLDEPTSSLDDAYRPLLVESLRKTGQNLKTTVVIATHDTKFIASLSGRILRMEKGTILDATDI